MTEPLRNSVPGEVYVDRIDAFDRFAARPVPPHFDEYWSEDADVSVGARFDQMAMLYPEHVAIQTVDSSISYEELNALTNRIANAALSRAEPGDRVLIMARGALDVIAAMLGTLKAGLVHVVLEVNTPATRLQYILEDSGAALVVVDASWDWATHPIAQTEIELLNLADLPSTSPDDPPGLEISADNPDRIIYTSGSTGMPKGVVRRHRATVTSVRNAANSDYYTRHDRIGMFGSPAFAASASGVYRALLTGATLLPFDPTRGGLTGLAEWINGHELTSVAMVPTLFRGLLTSLPSSTRFPSVRFLGLGAEPVYRTDVELYKRHFEDACIAVNSLAASECGVISQFFIDKETVIDSVGVPVGYPVPGRTVHFIDNNGAILEPGEVGEIAVGGQLFEYWNQPQLSERVFRPDPGGGPGLVYLTGDLGSQRPDGCIDYLGRKDFRVNVRGYSVEVAETELAMRHLPQIDNVVVVGRSAVAEDVRLIGYYVSVDGKAIPTSDLQAALAESLPSFAIPSAFVHLDTLPVGPSGKVDRDALPAPKAGTFSVAERTVPSDQLEAEIVEIWEDVLSLKGIGVNESFWDLGGTSIQGLMVFARISVQLGQDVPPTTLLEAKTVASLAARMREGEHTSTLSSLVRIQDGGSMAPFFCVHGGGGGVFYLRDISAHLDPDRLVYGLQAAGFDQGMPGVYRPVEELAARYITEIRTVQAEGPYILGGLSFGGLVAWEMAQQLTQEGQDVALVALLDTKISHFSRETAEDGFRRYGSRLQQMSIGAKVRYVAFGVFRRLWRSFRRLRVRTSLRLRHRLPSDLRKFHYFPLHARAARNYELRPYEGSVVVLSEQGAVDDHREYWGALCKSDLEIHEIPAGHFDMVREPHVQILAKNLDAAMDVAGAHRRN